MHKVLVYGACLLILLTANLLFPKLNGGVPNFLFLLALIYAVKGSGDEERDGADFLWLAFFGGVILDISSNVFFGTYTLSFLLIAMIANYVTRTFLVADPTTAYMAVLIIVANLLLIGLIYLFNSLGQKLDPNIQPLAQVYLRDKVWLDIILNLIFAAPIYMVTQLNQRVIQYYIQQSQRP